MLISKNRFVAIADFILFSWFFTVSQTALSQNENENKRGREKYTYRGMVADSLSRNPLESAVVVLADSTGRKLAETVTDAKGRFHISLDASSAENLPRLLTITYIGYSDLSLKLERNRLLPEVFYLKRVENVIEGATVTANKALHSADKNIYILTDKMREKASNAEELLDQLPGVRFDKISGKIRVGAETAVLLLVDGLKQSEIYIRNLPPDRIASVEVETDPTGRYLSEGYNAVVNFRLKKNYSGYDLDIKNLSALNFSNNNDKNHFPVEEPELGLTLTKGKVNLFLNYLYHTEISNSPIEKSQAFNQEIYTDSEEGAKENIGRYRNWSHSAVAGINYQIAKTHSLSFQFNYNYNRDFTDNALFYRLVHSSNNIIEDLNTSTLNRDRFDDYTGTMFYKGEVGRKLNLYGDFTYDYYADDVRNKFTQNESYINENVYSGKKNDTDLNLEATYKISGNTSIDASYSNVWRKYDSRRNTGEILLNYNEWRNKLFLSLKFSLPKNTEAKIGSGIEYIKYDNGTDAKNYWSLQPFAQINYPANKHLNINFSYTTNMYYPTLYQLSPMVTAIDSLMSQKGNPDLRPAVRHSISLSLIFWDRLTVKSIFKYTPQRISDIYSYEDDNFESSFVNMNTRQYIIQVIYDQPIGKYFSWSNMFLYGQNRSSYRSIKNKTDGWLWDTELNYYDSKREAGVQLAYYRDLENSILLQGYQQINMDSWVLTLNKQFWNKKASLMLSYVLPLKWGINENQEKKIETPFYSENSILSLKPFQNALYLRFNIRFSSGKVSSSYKKYETEKESRVNRTVGY